MLVFRTRADLSAFLSKFHLSDACIGFVPTMGALHQGHLSLVQRAKSESDLVVCSIFVNPTQFNDPKDLKKYPRTIGHDIGLLEQVNCDVLFLPEVAEVYHSNESWFIDLNGLDQVLEGKMRPEHYQGVTQVVKILFDIIRPTKAFFGQKDYQQCLVIQRMVDQLGMKVGVIVCPTVREADGLAMSSRNIHLSEIERKNATALYKALRRAQNEFPSQSIEQITTDVTNYLKTSPGIELEYFQICDCDTLAIASSGQAKLVALVAARVGKTRLIDNVLLE